MGGADADQVLFAGVAPTIQYHAACRAWMWKAAVSIEILDAENRCLLDDGVMMAVGVDELASHYSRLIVIHEPHDFDRKVHYLRDHASILARKFKFDHYPDPTPVPH